MRFSSLEVAALRFWEQLDSPKSLALAMMARAGDWTGILRASVNPNDYVDAHAYLRDNAACTFLKKNPSARGGTPQGRKQAALDKWWEGERSCYHTNERLARYICGLGDGVDDCQTEFFRLVRAQLFSWLGHAPSDAEIQRRARHGPGSTYSSLVRNPTKADKFSEKPTMTCDAVWHLADLVGTRWGAELGARFVSSHRDCVDVVRGNRFTTAPKTALTDRSIAVEPSINIYHQLAVGNAIRARLRRNTGWDLDHAADIHRKVARDASIDGSFATIDLSNASDTLSKNLVRILFNTSVRRSHESGEIPDRDWYALMDDLRSKTTVIDEQVCVLEKFSSMGNGYTFELETCVFAAISSVCLQLKGHSGLLGYDLFVYGDDIIVPTDSVKLVIDALSFCGFTINQEKSFVTGPFRESCGGDYFLGTPVRGYYLKSEVDEPESIFACYNGTRRVFSELGIYEPDFLEWLVRCLPTPLRRLGGPERLGDTVLHGRPGKFSWKDGIRWIRTAKFSQSIVIPWKFFTDDVRMTCSILGDRLPLGTAARGTTSVLEYTWVSDS